MFECIQLICQFIQMNPNRNRLFCGKENKKSPAFLAGPDQVFLSKFLGLNNQ